MYLERKIKKWRNIEPTKMLLKGTLRVVYLFVWILLTADGSQRARLPIPLMASLRIFLWLRWTLPSFFNHQ